VKQTLASAAVDLGWATIANQEEAKKARQKMKSEATPPPNAPPKRFVKSEAAVNAPEQAQETSTIAAKVTPQVPMTPRPTSTIPPTAAMSTTAPAISPTPTQRRERPPFPNATGTPQPTPRPTPKPVASAGISVAPNSGASTPEIGGPSRQETRRGKLRSETQSFGPRNAEPLASPSSTVTSTSAPNTEAVSSPSEKLTKKEKKELRREEKQEMKRQRKEGIETPSASPAP
jgi:hypothetical protein